MTRSLKRSLRSMVEATGHQIRKTDVYSSQRLRYRRLLSLLDIDLILDVGANAGQFATLCREPRIPRQDPLLRTQRTAYRGFLPLPPPTPSGP